MGKFCKNCGTPLENESDAICSGCKAKGVNMSNSVSNEYMGHENLFEKVNKKMFGNVANKIKILAQIVVWLGIALSVIGGIIVILSDIEYLFMGLLTIVIGSVAYWLIALGIYAFGELLESNQGILNKMNELKK